MYGTVRLAEQLKRAPQEAPAGGAGGRLRQGTGGGYRPATQERAAGGRRCAALGSPFELTGKSTQSWNDQTGPFLGRISHFLGPLPFSGWAQHQRRPQEGGGCLRQGAAHGLRAGRRPRSVDWLSGSPRAKVPFTSGKKRTFMG